jgi:transposase-like protein
MDAEKNIQKSNRSLPQPKRWGARKKSQVVLRLLRGESIDSVSREIGLQTYILEEWRQQGIHGIESSLTSRDNDPLSDELDKAMKRIGELSMENELLKERCRKQGPLLRGRSKK